MNLLRFFTILCYLSVSCSAINRTLSPDQSISDGETLVSSGQRFELGFFSPGQSKYKYLGIRYKTTPDVVVWVANRNTALSDSSGNLTISRNGTLILLNSTGSIVWSSNSSKIAARPVAKLLDTGNLVVVDETSTNLSDYLWQSFDFPGDTRLPGMLMGENLDTGMEQFLTSWRNSDDPSPGDFTYRVEDHGLVQIVLSLETRKRFRTGPWNGIRFNGLPMFPNPVFDATEFVFSEGRLVSLFDPYNDSFVSRLTLNQSGTIHRYKLDQNKHEWSLVYMIPNNPCDNYGQCGPNSVCNTNLSPMCRCLKGYKPKSQQDWDLFDWSGGCVRIVPSNCKEGDGFFEVSGVKLPDILQFQLKMNMSLSECKAECLRNCSCVAYTDPYANAGSNGCLMWYRDLLDIREFAEEKSEQNIYIRVPLSELENTGGSNDKKKGPAKLVWILIASGVLISGLIIGLILERYVKRGTKGKKEDLELPLFDFATISAATNNFSQANILGEGGFGLVYKGKLSGEQEIAVKRLSKNSGQGVEEFKNEVILIAKLQHRNLVRLLGCCIEGDERMLIYEYMQNKSLDRFVFGLNLQNAILLVVNWDLRHLLNLFYFVLVIQATDSGIASSTNDHYADKNGRSLLTWPKRFDIIMGIARGLLYLHEDSRLKIIHRDLKTSNILLDGNLHPKISDFGLARIFGGDQAFEKTKRVVGTYGYIAPEYAIDGEFSVKSDVFSIGVILLEIVSGKRNRNFSHPDHHHSLLGHAWLLWKENRALEVMDTCLKSSYVESQVKRCIQVGLLCVQKLAEDRPTMSSVLFMLANDEATLPQPKEPGFFIERSCSSADKSTFLGSEESTIEEVPIITQTQLLGR